MLSTILAIYTAPAIILLVLALAYYEDIILEAERSVGQRIGLPMFGFALLVVCVTWPVTLFFTLRNILALRNRQ